MFHEIWHGCFGRREFRPHKIASTGIRPRFGSHEYSRFILAKTDSVLVDCHISNKMVTINRRFDTNIWVGRNADWICGAKAESPVDWLPTRHPQLLEDPIKAPQQN